MAIDEESNNKGNVEKKEEKDMDETKNSEVNIKEEPNAEPSIAMTSPLFDGCNENSLRSKYNIDEDITTGYPVFRKQTANFDEPLVGLEYLIEIKHPGCNKPTDLACLLCDEKGDFQSVWAHLTTIRHYWSFLAKFFPSTEEKLSALHDTGGINTEQRDRLIQHLVARIEYNYGRRKQLLVSDTKFEGLKWVIFDMIENQCRHMREIPERDFKNCVDVNHLEPNVCPVGWLRRKHNLDTGKIMNISLPDNCPGLFNSPRKQSLPDLCYNALQAKVDQEYKNMKTDVHEYNELAKKGISETICKNWKFLGKRFRHPECLFIQPNNVSEIRIKEEENTSATDLIKQPILHVTARGCNCNENSLRSKYNIDEDITTGYPVFRKQTANFDEPLVGLEYLIEIKHPGCNKPTDLACLLCDEKGDFQSVWAHLTTIRHYWSFLAKFFPSAEEKLSALHSTGGINTEQRDRLIQHLVAQIEYNYGRQKQLLVSDTKFEGLKWVIFDMIENQCRHMREIPEQDFKNCVDVNHLEPNVCPVGWLRRKHNLDTGKIMNISLPDNCSGFFNSPRNQSLPDLSYNALQAKVDQEYKNMKTDVHEYNELAKKGISETFCNNWKFLGKRFQHPKCLFKQPTNVSETRIKEEENTSATDLIKQPILHVTARGCNENSLRSKYHIDENITTGYPVFHKQTANFDEPLVGIEYLIEIKHPGCNKPTDLACLLCDEKGDFQSVWAHLTTIRHYWSFLAKFFPSTEEKLSALHSTGGINTEQRDRLIQHLVARIEYIYGRQKQLLVSDTKFEGLKWVIFHLIENRRRHMREIPGRDFKNCVDVNHLEPNVCPVGWLRRKRNLHTGKIININLPDNCDGFPKKPKKQTLPDLCYDALQAKVDQECNNMEMNVHEYNELAKKRISETICKNWKFLGKRFRHPECLFIQPNNVSEIRKKEEEKTSAIALIKQSILRATAREENPQNITRSFSQGVNPTEKIIQVSSLLKSGKRKNKQVINKGGFKEVNDSTSSPQLDPFLDYREPQSPSSFKQVKRYVEHKNEGNKPTNEQSFLDRVASVQRQPSPRGVIQNATIQKRSDGDDRILEPTQLINETFSRRQVPNTFKRNCQTDNNDPQYLMKRPKPLSEESFVQNDPKHTENNDVMGVLRLLSALDTDLGSLGTKVVDLLSEALKLEKLSKGGADVLISREEIFLETVKEKLIGILELGLLNQSKSALASSLVKKIQSLISNHESKMSAKLPLSGKPLPLNVGPSRRLNIKLYHVPEYIKQHNSLLNISYKEKDKITKEICSHLQFKKIYEINEDTLVQLINDYVKKEDFSNESSLNFKSNNYDHNSSSNAIFHRRSSNFNQLSTPRSNFVEDQMEPISENIRWKRDTSSDYTRP